MKTVTLEAFRDESTGEIGLGVVGMPRDETTNAATHGLTIAHDLIEHVNGPERIGTIDDELEALGAIWYVRGQHGELRRDSIGSMYSVEQNIASDITRMFRDWFYAGRPQMSYLPRTRATPADDAIACILNCADDSWRSELDEEERHAASDAWNAYRAECFVRMRTGYRKARRTWERYGSYAANTQFWAIAEALNDICKRMGEGHEGARFTLRYGKGDATCEEAFDDYE